MLEKPNIPDESILAHLREEYDIRAAELTFLPIGADSRTAVYGVKASDGRGCFLKLRKKFREVIVLVPLFLAEKGFPVLVPFQAKSGRHWADFGEYKLILYPFIQGQDGFEVELTGRQRHTLGGALRGIHDAHIPSDLKQLIRKETFSPEWREDMRSFLVQVQRKTFEDPTAVKLAEFIRSKQNEIAGLIERTEQLAAQLQSKPLDKVLCHSDIHGGNILISSTGELYIVDWDDPILAPRERDLMFIGGGIDEIWKSEREEAEFYEGYGKTEINLLALAYYRYERVIEDLAVICEQLLSSDEGGADRERAFGWFTSNFEPGNTLEIAEKTDKLLTKITKV